MSDPRDADPHRSALPRRLDPEATSRRSIWPWLAALVIILVIVGMAFRYNGAEQTSNNQSNAPTTTGAAPSEPPRPTPPATPGGNTPATPAAPAPNDKR
jgi:hypothetical protein